MPNKLRRIILTVKDIQLITGKSYKTAQRTMIHLRDVLGKSRSNKVTIKEYAQYNAIDIEDIFSIIN